ncbi:MAG: bifunctional diaminohydroxyphosphoribosylaminopyrimidine deaminase/5-amino-6-(5-phosphoribosylamino)uracil reductase RibD [Myxococcota bacterium]
MSDRRFMSMALDLAEAGLGSVWPNPSVGALVVRDGEVVGQGQTQPRGRPHAEVVALEEAGERARGSAVYCSLEPCCHWGETPPCTDALIRAGVARVVVSVTDPDPRVNGSGVTRLRNAGIDVSLGLLEERGRAVNAGFFSRIRLGRPHITQVGEPDAHLDRFDGVWTRQIDRDEVHVSAGPYFREVWAFETERRAIGAAAADRVFWLPEPASTPAGFRDALRQLAQAGLTRLAVGGDVGAMAHALDVLDANES